VLHRPLALVSALTLGDYLVWDWSLGGNHDVFALVSGLTLPPLLIALLWLAVLTVTRVLAGTARRSRADVARRAAARARAGEPLDQPAAATGGAWKDEQASARSSKIAA
jgi:hypothetical protein